MDMRISSTPSPSDLSISAIIWLIQPMNIQLGTSEHCQESQCGHTLHGAMVLTTYFTYCYTVAFHWHYSELNTCTTIQCTILATERRLLSTDYIYMYVHVLRIQLLWFMHLRNSSLFYLPPEVTHGGWIQLHKLQQARELLDGSPGAELHGLQRVHHNHTRELLQLKMINCLTLQTHKQWYIYHSHMPKSMIHEYLVEENSLVYTITTCMSVQNEEAYSATE